MARLIQPSGEVRDVQPANGATFTLKELQGFVGGYIEIINGGEFFMVLNEEGKLRSLPVNDRATRLTRHLLRPADVIVGNALVCSFRELEADEDAE